MAESAKQRDSMASTFWNEMDKIDGFFPGHIVSLGNTDGLVSVQPHQKVKFLGEDLPTQLPIIDEVLLLQTRTPGVIIRVPKEKLVGAKVGIFIADHSLEEWREQKGQPNFPVSGRRFNINDAVAVLGMYPETDPWKVTQKPNTFEIQVSNGGKIGIGDTAGNELLKILYDLIDALTLGITGPDGDTLTGASQISALKTQLALITNI